MRRGFMLGLWLTSTSLITSAASAQAPGAGARTRPQPTADAGAGAEDPATVDEEIVVNGQRPRGSVIGHSQPELTLNGGDVRALGVSSISELLAELGPQLTSARGGQPIVLLEGRRVSSFREIATLPTEAIQRVEILPEEVALKYGYAANQKVMNVVLRRRFRAVTVEAADRVATEGGANKIEGETGFLTIRPNGRLNLNMDFERTAALAESERGIVTDTGGDTMRSLSPSQRTLTITGTYARNFSQKVDGSINGELEVNRANSLIGMSTVPGLDVFERTAKDLSASLGTTLNAQGRFWRGTLTGTYNHGEGRTISVRGTPADLAETSTDTATADLTVNGSLYRLPAGEISLTARLGGTIDSVRSDSERASIVQTADLSRSIGLGALSLDVPLVKSPSSFIGRLSANGNVEVQALSDFGALTSHGFGLTWTPGRAVSVIASYDGAETAPSMQQLGNPQVPTPLVPVFDYVTGQSVLVTRVSGGNPDLLAAEKREWRLGLTLKPFTAHDLTLSVNYNNARTDNGISPLPALTTEIQSAFSERFIREDSELLRIIATPVNIARQESEVLRWGINFTKRLKTPQSQLDAIRAAFQRRQGEREGAAGPSQGGGFGGDRPGQEPGSGGSRGPRGSGGGQGGGGRINLALYHSWHLAETAVLRDGMPEIDLLRGGTIGTGAGQPRHEVELQAGVAQSGLGLRLTGKWQSATRVNDATGSSAADLRFSSLTTLNLRLFANPGQMPGLIGKYPWMRGLRLSVRVNNLLNDRQEVTDGTGATPYAFQPGYLDPLGRTVQVSVRKLFF